MESIYNLLPPNEAVPPRPPTYKSKYPGEVNPAAFPMGVSKRGKGTFGPAAGASKPEVGTFLKKHTGEPTLPDPAPLSKTKSKSKPAVPSKEEKPLMGLVSSKNFVTSNAVENILSTPSKVAVPEVLATQKAGFGKTPGYLKKVKSQIAAEKAYIEEQTRAAEQAAATGSMRKMSDEERDILVTELKLKWQRVNEAYQKLPFTLDTPMRRMRKEKYEEELTQLEKDIETLSRKTVIITEGFA
mmetsp:Transcript_7796/g.25902  ORF Transcript_7796/g.25902 Transcript_7796/m.25902 type:complete len:242 (-) Transcript_7796:43-768(-)